MLKKRNSFPFFTLLVCSLAIIMIAFIGYFVYNMLSQAPEIVFRSYSAQKPYDGTELTEHTWEMESGELKEGHRVSVEVTGTQTRIGTSKNYFKVLVYDEAGNNVSGEYMIIYDYGYLTVYNPDEVEYIDPDNPDGDGSFSGSGGEMNQDVIKIFTSRSDVVYLRQKSYGNFTGVDWNERIPSYGNKNGANPLTYLSYALQMQSYPVEEMHIKADMGVTYTPYHFTDDTNLCDADDRLLPYSGSSYTVNYCFQYDVSLLKKLSLVGSELENEEEQYSEYVYDNYLTLTSNEKGTLIMLANKAGIYKDDENVIELVADYIMNSATYNLSFEPYPDDVNHALYFLLEAREGVCVQYATAATLMYRALGIPARYVTGYMGFTEAYQWAEIPVAIGHAWVEVYIDGLGWIPVEVTPPTGNSGDGSDVDGSTLEGSNVDGSGGTSSNPKPPNKDNPLGELPLTPVYVSKKYDGEPVYAVNQLTGFEEWEALGYTYETVVSGEQTEYGFGVSKIESVTLFDPDGNDVTEQFDPIKKNGQLHVYHSILASYSKDMSIVYDGRSSKEFDVENLYVYSADLMEGHIVVFTPTAPTVVGEYVNSYDISVVDDVGKDVSQYYEFQSVFGKLEVSAKEIRLIPSNVKKVYDGTPLVADRYELSGELVSGHSISSYVITGSQTEIGRSDSIISNVQIVDAGGNDVTSNYAIQYGVGVLTVTAG